MKIASFNGFPFHYEMFGYLIDYCKSQNIELDIYTVTNNNMNWIKFYLLNYGKYFKIKHINNFEINNNYDKIILLTDDDFSFKEEWIKNLRNKLLCIDHDKNNRRESIITHIGTRFFPSKPDLDWILPVYKIIDVDNKKNISKNNIVVIGSNTHVINFNIFENFEKYTFTLIDRYLNIDKYKKYNNILCYSSTSTIDMIDILKKSDYVYISENNQKDYIGSCLTSSIPLALNCLCTLIIPKNVNKYYNIKSAIDYDDKIILTDPDYIKVDKDLNILIDHRNNIFNKYIKINTALICEPRKLDHIPLIIKQYKIVLGNNWKIVFYCGKNLKSYWEKIFDLDIEIRELDVNNLTSNEYNDYFKKKELWESLYGDFVLVFQSDTWIHYDNFYNINYFINMDKSYIGGNMCYPWFELNREKIIPKYRNFNGGLSLRKRNDMIKIINTYPSKKTVEKSLDITTDAEDVYFTIGCYKLGLSVGDDEESSYFAVHTIYKSNWFGIHCVLSNIKDKLIIDYPMLKKDIIDFV